MKANELNNFELKALRQGLSLTVAEMSELAGVSKRAFQYWESGRYEIPSEWIDTCWNLVTHYELFVRLLEHDIAEWKTRNPALETDDVSEYKEWVKTRPVLTLPLFSSFDQFGKITKHTSIPQWRIYQSAVSHFFSIGKVERLDDTSQIPEYFKINGAINGDYDLINERSSSKTNKSWL